jgi:F-type H+-transporting ATPase subunit gamma
MPSIKDLKKRIGSTKNTQQTTKAMKMVSAAKLRRAQDAITNQRPYAKQVNELMRRVSTLSESGAQSSLIAREGGATKRMGLLVVTSDRGLCAGFNANIIKTTQRWLAANSDKYESVTLSFVGKRGYDFFKTKKVKLGVNYSEFGGKISFVKAKGLADAVVKKYLDGEVDEVQVIYNEFKNAVSQQVVVERYLPILPPAGAGAQAKPQGPSNYIVKPSADEVLVTLLKKNFAIQAFRILLESQAGEHGARMSAMENATKNAGEMIRKLTLQYNKQRQAGITKELLEIISGSESQKTAS